MGRKGLLAIVLLSLFIAFILKIFSGSLRNDEDALPASGKLRRIVFL